MSREKLERLACFARAELTGRLALAKRELESGALEVLHEDLDVVGIDARLFDGRAEQIRRIAREILIERSARRDQHRDAELAAPTGASEALPESRHRAGVARAD